MISRNFHDLLFFRILLFVQNCLMLQESLFCGFLVRLSFHLGKPQVSLEILVKIVCNVFHLGPLQMPFTSNWGLFERRANLPSFPQVSWEPSLSCQPCISTIATAIHRAKFQLKVGTSSLRFILVYFTAILGQCCLVWSLFFW